MEIGEGIRVQKVLIKLALLQDMADALMAIGDLQGGKSVLGHPVFVSVCGIFSAAVGVYSKWES